MRSRESHSWKALTNGLMGIALMAFVVGCGDMDRSPLSPTGDGAGTAVTGTGAVLTGNVNHIAFSPFALAKKISGYETKGDLRIAWVKDQFDLDDDVELELKIDKYGDKETIRVEKAKFEAEDGSIDHRGVLDEKLRKQIEEEEEVEITMQVTSGSTLGDVLVSFTPSGLAFSPAAELELHLKGKVAGDNAKEKKRFEIVAYHISGDGTVTKILAVMEGKANSWKITVDVPGFSEYDWDDAAEPDAP